MTTSIYLVKSSNISSMMYHEGIFVVNFKNNSRYAYKNVTPGMVFDIAHADSVGKAFQEIRNNPSRYPYEKIA